MSDMFADAEPFLHEGRLTDLHVKRQNRRVTSQRMSQNRPKAPSWFCKGLKKMAGTTGLEPAASAVTESLADVTYWNLTVLTARS